MFPIPFNKFSIGAIVVIVVISILALLLVASIVFMVIKSDDTSEFGDLLELANSKL